MSKEIKNYGRSVKTKLLTLSKESGIPYMTILVRYFQERLLYRVAHSVGRTLRYAPGAVDLPCHRVVNKEGRTAPGWSRQRQLLEAEGVTFKPNGHVDMQRHLWAPDS